MTSQPQISSSQELLSWTVILSNTKITAASIPFAVSESTLEASDPPNMKKFFSDLGIFSGIRVINNSQSDRVDFPSHK
ncbi:hypothetical protein RIR_jg32397.t1 [Rhizophagus irregularis DAOM 181602=DAOM 197198]|nr:hypothetical protein RIR_jg32397.t1 [Rhizophagus irregularis DAOM 181602=DAOM 197198]